MSDDYIQRARARRDLSWLEPHEMTVKELKTAIKKHTDSVNGFKKIMDNISIKAQRAEIELKKRNKFKIVF